MLGCVMLFAAECFTSEYKTLSSVVKFLITLGAGDGFLVRLECRFKSAYRRAFSRHDACAEIDMTVNVNVSIISISKLLYHNNGHLF